MRSDLTNLLNSGCRLQSAVRDIRSATFYIAYHGENERDLLSFVGDFYAAVDPSLGFVAPHCRSPRPARSKLRVGFLSRFFCNHSVGLHYGRLIREMRHDDFEIFVLRVANPSDAVAQSILDAADAHVDLSTDFERARRQVADCELDILIYTDLGMDYFTYFLAFARLAPVQCVLAGHPLTTGIPTIDYFLSNDAMEPADGASHYRERLVRLGGLLTRLERPQFDPRPTLRESLGFRRQDHLYLCPQTLFKLHPDFDPVLGDILRRDPKGLLVLFQADSPDWSRLLMDRFHRTMPDVVRSIRWLDRLPMPDFLALLADSDVILDTPHFNGGTTSMLALGVNAPIVTLPGPFMRGRTTLVCYRKLGIPDLIATDSVHYVELATSIACDPELRAAHQGRIAGASELLFEQNDVVREFEACLRELASSRADT